MAGFELATIGSSGERTNHYTNKATPVWRTSLQNGFTDCSRTAWWLADPCLYLQKTIKLREYLYPCPQWDSNV
jgi:hypothetical protein